MKAVIPVAGIGKRLRPLTNNKPKVLIPVNGKPMLGHLLDRLKKEDISEYIFITSYKREMVEDYIKKEYSDLNSKFVFQEEMKGTAHAISLAKNYVDEDVLIIFGDTLFQGELNLDCNEDGVIMVNETNEPERLGIVELNGEYVVGMEEKPKKPKSNLAIIGIYHINNYKLLFSCIDN